jgi:hypothetical protein
MHQGRPFEVEQIGDTAVITCDSESLASSLAMALKPLLEGNSLPEKPEKAVAAGAK